MRTVGVLALQGDVPEHRAAITALRGPEAVRIVAAVEDLEGIGALILPGGESTTISRLLGETGLDRAIVARAADGLPMLATCAGLILLSRELEASPGGRDPVPLGLFDLRIRRNDYGRQRESFEAPVAVNGLAGGPFPGVFIRAPRILHVGPKVDPFAHWEKEIVGVRQGALWGLTFHPELSGDLRLLRAFLDSTEPPSKRTRRRPQ